MADGSSGNAFGDALESMTTNTKKAIGGTIADFTKSAANQVKGTGGISGSFTPSQGSQQPQNPNQSSHLSGGDLFSPDMAGNKQKITGQNQQGLKPLTVAGQQLAQNPNAKTPEEVAKIQSIEQELRSMHKEYFQDFLAKAEGRDRKTVTEKQEKAQDDEQKQMADLQKKEEKKQADDASLKRSQQSVENKGGGAG